ncbi:hypothetical protein [Fibrobacter sp. UBA4309]|jgi:hypothetical protein|uniref:hypothetical protein n=1 Tax=Fibrobacter sp. UBA4309 TaxID=1946537 RepID=UPI0025BF87FF|nr:hypothetical protein [Fibrobacter sp. UBA4309]
MKKIISAFAATVVISTLAACTAADDSTISGPRMGKVIVDPGSSQQSGQQGSTENKDKNTKAIEKICDSYTIEQEYPEEDAVLYYCRDDGNEYGCISGACEEISEYED